MSDTPRTDEAKAMATVPFEKPEVILVTECVPADFSRQLERELAAVKEAFESSKKVAIIASAKLADTRAELAAAKAERDALRGFVAAVFEESGWPNGGDIDGFAFQDAAIAAGLLTGETRTVPCGESCHCAEYHGDISEGVTCYRKAPWLLAAAINAARAK